MLAFGDVVKVQSDREGSQCQHLWCGHKVDLQIAVTAGRREGVWWSSKSSSNAQVVVSGSSVLELRIPHRSRVLAQYSNMT